MSSIVDIHYQDWIFGKTAQALCPALAK